MKYIIAIALVLLPVVSFAAVDCSQISCDNGPLPDQWGKSAPRYFDQALNAWFVDITGTQYYRDQMTKLGQELKAKNQCALFPMFAVWCK